MKMYSLYFTVISLCILYFNLCKSQEVKIIDFENIPVGHTYDRNDTLSILEKSRKRIELQSEVGDVNIQYQGGNSKQRKAVIVEDPVNPENNVILFEIADANCCGAKRGRVQLNAYELANLNELELSVRVFLPHSMKHIESFPGSMNFLTISEWWNDVGWGTGNPFRISLNLVKKTGDVGSPLIFEIRSQVKDETKVVQWQGSVWSAKNEDFVVPYGEWFKLTYHFKNGNSKNGLFKLDVDYKGKKVNVFDIKDWTHSPVDESPSGLKAINPMKLYANYQLIEHMRSKGTSLKIYWDDLEFRHIN